MQIFQVMEDLHGFWMPLEHYATVTPTASVNLLQACLAAASFICLTVTSADGCRFGKLLVIVANVAVLCAGGFMIKSCSF